ncbi:hypothetical protein Goklo_002944 [Gossypium klotzschianum]|uniref:Uncharacterized protein n=1 Tax=Gossypium klotzschianum TaxID=34286 RepID=A0A7J8VUQ9_9ROSI|nr:hypothetical protein [Gossypium klotzschianum]
MLLETALFHQKFGQIYRYYLSKRLKLSVGDHRRPRMSR